jgi:hypothetical protein
VVAPTPPPPPTAPTPPAKCEKAGAGVTMGNCK